MQMLYKPGSEIKVNNLWPCDTVVAYDDDEKKDLLAEGWFETAMEACVPKAEREKALSDIVKKSKRNAEANARELAAQNLDPTASRLINDQIPR
jgi:hypothetical protein